MIVVAVLLSSGRVHAQEIDRTPQALLAVAPFDNITGAASDAWIGEGIAETVGVGLVSATGLSIARAGQLATWVVTGAYQRVGDRLRITAQLRTNAGSQVAGTAKVDGAFTALFDLQDQLVAELALGLTRWRGRVATGAAAATPVRDAAEGSGSGVGVDEPVRRETPVDTTLAPVVVGDVIIDGAAPPLPPAVVSYDARGRATVRAVRVPEGLRLDGRLDEEVFDTVAPIGNFIQVEPNAGEPATEPTEVWIFFDDDTLYVAARCYDSQPEERWVANEMRRDSMNVVRNENFAIVFDTFYDRRNGVIFEVSPIGGIWDGQVTNEGMGGNSDWNPVWEWETGRFEGGWTAEMAIPFRSLRYRPGRNQVWGVNIRRNVRWKNEESFFHPVPANRGSVIFQISLGGTLVGLDAPAGSRNLEIKPYAISNLTTNLQTDRPSSNDLAGDVGLDVKYGVTQNLTADFTYNTDFAQVEVDEQQVNLTRFSLFFPEKREFFLEGQGIFEFGGARSRGFGGGGGTPILFYSRHIGLSRGQAVPIQAGGRLTGKVGSLSIGLMNVGSEAVSTASVDATNFSAVRLKQDLLRRSSVGALVTSRSVSVVGDGSSQTYGLDAAFGFYDNVNINSYLAKTETPGLTGDDTSYRAQLDYNGDRYGLTLEQLMVGDHFNPEVGFLRRDDFRRSAASARFSPRPRSIAAIRRLSWQGNFDYLTDGAGRLETREASGQFAIEFENSDQLSVNHTRSYEFLESPFGVASGVTIPVGGYNFHSTQASMTFGNQRRLSGGVSVSHGTFFSGERTTVGFNRGRIELTPQFSLEPGVSVNWVDLPDGAFATTLGSSRVTYTLTPRMFVAGLVQYNSSNDSLSTNLRLRWEYQAGSELFVVYTDERDTELRGFPRLENRAFVVKFNRLFRF